MDEWIISIIVLGLALGVIIIFRDKINEGKISVKIGIFSIIVAILANIFGRFEPIGYLIQAMAIVCVIMSIIINIFTLIFKQIKDITVRIILFSIFLFMIFSALGNSNDILYLESEFFMYMNTGKMISIIIILMCILVKSFQLIFIKETNKDKKNIDELYDSNELQGQ